MELPGEPGCYVLAVRVLEGLEVRAGRLRAVLERGLYLYVGSAGGPGGLRARVSRHFRRGKRVWWHIDRLTTSPHAMVVGVAYCARSGCGVPGESRVVSCLASRGYTPVAGFGSSDDPGSPGHLLKAPAGPEGLDKAMADALDCLSHATPGARTCSAHRLEDY